MDEGVSVALIPDVTKDALDVETSEVNELCATYKTLPAGKPVIKFVPSILLNAIIMLLSVCRLKIQMM